MPDYRRRYQPGGTYFFTVVTCRCWKLFRNPNARGLLGSVIRQSARERPFDTLAIVLLPDHLHCVWSLPGGDADYSSRWKAIKDRFTGEWIDSGGRELPVTRSQGLRGHRGIWQRRFWEHLIHDEADLERCCDYIHYNPVKHGYVRRPWDWPWSSFRRFVRSGQYLKDWGRSEPAGLAGMGWE
jgi:putative transposase